MIRNRYFRQKYLQKKKKLKLFKQKRQLVNVISLALANQMNTWKKHTHVNAPAKAESEESKTHTRIKPNKAKQKRAD